ncbi:hypothetical protein F441_16960 [Phytophthora nicotianae CJ01A1]|uniref:Uncharacterized protein n=3 Tax=Phytophthora nicotianae TaxID=4792 RepID=W2WAX6_PHYNI|nr:hypothetical protein L917_16353 [Phytophthora nicotianae]ETO65586.1 hypothetical protein F444_17130 [Phytophthora nicotianae P1976]ETP06694.1 hypothetical protein F441_16960 [Phytophthora nicotianae CJ01A1]
MDQLYPMQVGSAARCQDLDWMTPQVHQYRDPPSFTFTLRSYEHTGIHTCNVCLALFDVEE